MRFFSRLLSLSATLLLAAAVSAAEPIRVGEYGAFSGKEAAFGLSSRKGVTLALEEANAAGGVLGRILELVAEDNQSKAGESATIAKNASYSSQATLWARTMSSYSGNSKTVNGRLPSTTINRHFESCWQTVYLWQNSWNVGRVGWLTFIVVTSA